MANFKSRFQHILRELFQFDSTELDFGIYKILNYKRKHIKKFIEEDISEIVDLAFARYRDERVEDLGQRLEEARQKVIEALNKDVFLPCGDLKEEFKGFAVAKAYQELKERKDDADATDEVKVLVYNDLYNFFSRYYDEGDFAPKYRYSIKGHKYAIPYNGEEVKLYWATSDQYYIKTGVLFRDYTFFADNSKTYKIILRTVAAKEELGSNKATKARFFVLDNEKPLELLGENALVIRLQYRELTAAGVKRYEAGGGSNTAKQDRINQHIMDSVLEGLDNPHLKGFLSAYTNNDKPLLLHQLSRFTAKNSRDFFIHKNLKKFLSDQLDYFIKSEVISIDTLERERFLDRHLTRAKVVREIGGRIIDFLAQIEDFQKRLWKKKKFVLKTEYVITADRVPEAFYPEILKNKKQAAEWEALGFGKRPSKAGLKEKKLPIDTKYFSEDFKERLLEKLTETVDLDDLLDGLMIKSENWQALNLLQNRYREGIKCIHIDPPYNTQTSGFLYKNTYQHSSWLTMMGSRIELGIGLLSPDGSFLCHVDENEYERLQLLFGQFPVPDAGTIAWDKRNPMNAGRGVATQHEYIAWRTRRQMPIYLRDKNIPLMLKAAAECVARYGAGSEESQKHYSAWVNSNRNLTGGEKAYRYLDEKGYVYQSVSLRAPEPRTDPKFHIPLLHPVTKRPCPVPPNGFSRTPETLKNIMDRGEIIFGPDESTQPRQKVLLKEESKRQISSVITNAKKGKADLSPLGLDFPYCHPVSLYEELIGAAAQARGDIVLDFFGGSSTSAHAVMSLNNDTEDKLKFIYVELANYFEEIAIRRIKKVAYSFNWKDGKPKDSDGNGVFFKYQVLEQYEDTLDNLELKENRDALSLFGNDYLLKYFLDFESRNNAALVNFEHFKKPFSYKLKVNPEEVGEPEEAIVDLPETFHYLLGLKIKKLKVRNDRGRKYLFSLGEKGGRNIAVVWREYDDDWSKPAFQKDKEFIIQEIQGWAPQVVYVNGQSALTPKIGSLTVEVRAIEPEFRKRMVDAS